jgi:hypothetical protein
VLVLVVAEAAAAAAWIQYYYMLWNWLVGAQQLQSCCSNPADQAQILSGSLVVIHNVHRSMRAIRSGR